MALTEMADSIGVRRMSEVTNPAFGRECAELEKERDRLRIEVEYLGAAYKRLEDKWNEIAYERNDLRTEVKRLRSAKYRLLALFEDHFWDSLQPQKELILRHIKSVMATEDTLV